MSENRSGPASSVFGATRRLLSSLVNAGESRARLAIIELKEERNRVVSLLITAFAALLLAAFGIGMLMLLIVAWYWDTPYRFIAIGSCAGVLLLLALICAIRIKVLTKRTMLASTMNQLQKDRQQLDDPDGDDSGSQQATRREQG